MDKYWQSRIRILRPEGFEALALELFAWQFDQNPLYHSFCQMLNRTPDSVRSLADVPYMPVTFFKTNRIRSGKWDPVSTFCSSGTMGMERSYHDVKTDAWYLESATSSFSMRYGSPNQYAWLALLPGYLERTDSSLIHMIAQFIHNSIHEESGFFLDDFNLLKRAVDKLSLQYKPTILFGVTHALLRFAELFPSSGLQNVLVMETGGMKGHGIELIRTEVHQSLKNSLGVTSIHSEYGMTEMFSQAYASHGGFFTPGPSLRVTTRDINDPFQFPGYGRTGLLCMCDLANYATQSFIATQDLGRVYPDGRFEMLGRLDGSDIRGCNLLVDDLLQ